MSIDFLNCKTQNLHELLQMERIFISILLMTLLNSKSGYGFPMDISHLPPEEMSGFFEGDMELDEHLYRNSIINPMSGLINTKHRWPRNLAGAVVVPYTFSTGSPFSEFETNQDFRKYSFSCTNSTS